MEVKQGWKKFEKKPIDENSVVIYRPFTFAVNNDVPDEVKESIRKILVRLNEDQYTIRLGGNKGYEEDLETLFTLKEIHLPWKGFNEKESKSTFNSPESFVIAKRHSPVYDRFSDAIKAILARNVRLVLGDKLKSPSLFCITYTEDGCEHSKNRTIKTGNSGHVISLASYLNLPIFNFKNESATNRLLRYLEI